MKNTKFYCIVKMLFYIKVSISLETQFEKHFELAKLKPFEDVIHLKTYLKSKDKGFECCTHFRRKIWHNR